MPYFLVVRPGASVKQRSVLSYQQGLFGQDVRPRANSPCKPSDLHGLLVFHRSLPYSFACSLSQSEASWRMRSLGLAMSLCLVCSATA